MKPVWWMIAGSVTSWVVAMGLVGTDARWEGLLGMIGPLVVTSGSWLLTERTYQRNPQDLTPLMVKTFAGKMVFFGAYVAVILSTSGIRHVPFVVSFTGYFIALHLTEALCLRRLFAGDGRA
jgi:hypothetical protein